jgi:hypothetical protein
MCWRNYDNHIKDCIFVILGCNMQNEAHSIGKHYNGQMLFPQPCLQHTTHSNTEYFFVAMNQWIRH